MSGPVPPGDWIRKIKAGEVAHLAGATIPAAAVRELLLGGEAPNGVRIDKGRIDGQLSLKDARGPGGRDCDPLVLTNCELLGVEPEAPGIDARYGRFARIDLSGCTTTGLDLTGASIAGDLCIDGMTGKGGDGELRPCWVIARGLRVDGAITARRTKLALPWKSGTTWSPEHECWSGIGTPFSLDLRNARIGTWLMLTPGFDAVGGVSIAGATIGGEFWASGAVLTASGFGRSSDESPPEALFGQRATIEGFFAVGVDSDGRAANVNGPVQLREARLNGSLHLRNVAVSEHRGGDDWVNLSGAKVAGDALIVDEDGGRARVSRVLLESTDIGGDFMIQIADPVAAVAASGLSVKGSVDITGSIAELDLSTSVIDGALRLAVGGALLLRGTHVGGDVSIDQARGVPIGSVSASSMSVGGDLTLRGRLSGVANLEGVSVEGKISLGDSDRALRLDAEFGLAQPKLVLDEATARLSLEVPGLAVDRSLGPARAVRAAALGVFRGWSLGQVEVTVPGKDGVGVIDFLFRPDDASDAIILNGESAPLFRHETLGVPRLDRRRDVDEYLALFCAHVWGDDGAFEIVDDPSVLKDLAPAGIALDLPATRLSGDAESASLPRSSRPWIASAFVRYGDALFKATFQVQRDGSVVMVDDEPIRDGLPEGAQWGTPSAPFRWIASEDAVKRLETERPPIAGDRRWRPLVGAGARIWDVVRSQLEPTVQLSGLKVGTLDDDGGRRWGDHVRLALDGFRYDRMPESPVAQSADLELDGQPFESVRQRSFAREATKRSAAEDRARWLRAAKVFTPAPYQQLANIWRSEGEHAFADEITIQRLKRERIANNGLLVKGRRRIALELAFVGTATAVAAILIGNFALLGDQFGSWLILGALGSGLLLMSSSRLREMLLERPFGYGLRLSNAVLLFVGLWVFGGIGALLGTTALTNYALKIDTGSISTVAYQTTPGDPNTVRPVVVPQVGDKGIETEVACVGQIDPVMYALDVMVPLLDLRQEQRCRPSNGPDGWLVRFLKVAYAVLGWAAVSGLLLTGSGVIRRQVER